MNTHERQNTNRTEPHWIIFEWARLWSAHDVDGLLALFTDDASYRDLAIGHSFYGRKQIEDFVRGTFVTFPDFRVDILHAVADEVMVAGEWEMSGTFSGPSFGQPPTGKRFRVPGCSVVHLRGGRIALHTDYWNEATFVEQVRADKAQSD